jgi:hypothetical protein
MRVRTIDLLSVIWFALGIVVFLLGWCNWYCSIPITFMIVWVIWKMWFSEDTKEIVQISKRKVFFAFVIIVVLMTICGIGGYIVQPNDDFGRNAIFKDIVNYSWPVYDYGENHYQCYYLAFWLVPALFGKLFNSIDVGFFMQLLWISLGGLLLFIQICRYMGKSRLSYLFFVYFFAGLKIIECFLYLPLFGDGGIIGSTIRILATNDSPGVFHAGPIVQLFYDPFNQTVPLFLIMMYMLNNRHSSFIPFVYSLLLLYAPFPFIGLSPIVLYLFIKNILAENKKHGHLSIFCLENFTALLILIVIGLYLSSNINGSHRGLRPTANLFADIYDYFIYIIFEFGIYIVIGYKVCRDKLLLWIALVSVCIMSWFQVGLHNDFCFRTNMPLIFILALLVVKRFYQDGAPSWIKKVIITCYIIGGLPAQIHPFLRLLSSYCIASNIPQVELNDYQHYIDVRKMYIMQQTKMRNNDLKSTFHCGSWGWMCDSFKGRADSFFFKYLVKKQH